MSEGGWISYKQTGDTLKDCGVAFGCFLLMCYTFIGIAIASDIFMNGIEKICGATKTVKTVKEEDGVIVVTTKETQVWNETVANLTLMALGSSAPEILLSAIEISEGLGAQNPGELGPGTIVGSAAFNLMIISAVCIVALPPGATSRIKLYKVFAITSVTSLFSYIWMVIVLVLITPDVVTLWEAVLTLVFFPLLVIIAYWADQDFCCSVNRRRSSIVSASKKNSAGEDVGRDFYFGDQDADNLYDAEGNYDKVALANLYEKLQDIADLSSDEIVRILATKLIQGKQHNRTWYRQQMSKALMGGGKMVPVLDEKLQEVVDVLGESGTGGGNIRHSMLHAGVSSVGTLNSKAIVEFQAATLAVAESIGQFQVTIKRSGKEDVGFEAQIDSADGTAKKGKEYHGVSERIKFDPYVMDQIVTVKIIDNVQWNPDSNFYLRVSIPEEFKDKATLGQMRIIEIIIEDDDKPGKLSFEKRGYVLKDSVKKASIDVSRTDGTDGVVSVAWKTIPGPNCKLVLVQEGRLEFQHGEMKKFIEIPFKLSSTSQVKVIEGQDETFEIVLSDPKGGAKIGKIPKTVCAISSDEHFKLEINNVVNAALKICEESEEDVTYKDQILQAILVNGGDTQNADCKDWFLHLLTFPLKLACSLIPPSSMCGGWLCFFLALFVVGLLTKLVGDTASAFGEAIGMDATITAITFVALGTSLPDTFASRIAAINDKTADNAIGNVTGSNSVNVFLGLGVPWTIGAIFYMLKEEESRPIGIKLDGKAFCVPAGTLGFNVGIFSACAFLSILILTWRRCAKSCGRAELGGPNGTKWISAISMIILWLIYIAASSWKATANQKETVTSPISECHAKVHCYKLKRENVPEWKNFKSMEDCITHFITP